MTGAGFLNGIQKIKLLHKVIWFFFATCILAAPGFAYMEQYSIALFFLVVVSLEVLVIAFNGGYCPLTLVAYRYTEDRAENFDIYLPVWLAKYNKLIFGILFLVGGIYVLLKWSTII